MGIKKKGIRKKKQYRKSVNAGSDGKEHFQARSALTNPAPCDKINLNKSTSFP
jgi:hypothetical protein